VRARDKQDDSEYQIMRSFTQDNPKAFRRYLRRRRLEPFVKGWSLVVRHKKAILIYVFGLISAVLAQWIGKLLGLS